MFLSKWTRGAVYGIFLFVAVVSHLLTHSRQIPFKMEGRIEKIFKLLSQTFYFRFCTNMSRGEVGNNFTACSGEDTDAVLLKNALKFFDSDFFNEDKVKQMAKGALEFNVPAFQKNRKLVASVNGGLHDPSMLVFNPSWDTCGKCHHQPRFNYTSISGILRPEDEEDIAFMTILELGELIKTKQITSQKLTEIFLRRMRRYNPVLEAVITYTEDLAYTQAKKADDLLGQGVYLGILGATDAPTRNSTLSSSSVRAHA